MLSENQSLCPQVVLSMASLLPLQGWRSWGFIYSLSSLQREALQHIMRTGVSRLLAQAATAICSTFLKFISCISPAHLLNFILLAKLHPDSCFRKKTQYYTSVFTLEAQIITLISDFSSIVFLGANNLKIEKGLKE